MAVGPKLSLKPVLNQSQTEHWFKTKFSLQYKTSVSAKDSQPLDNDNFTVWFIIQCGYCNIHQVKLGKSKQFLATQKVISLNKVNEKCMQNAKLKM